MPPLHDFPCVHNFHTATHSNTQQHTTDRSDTNATHVTTDYIQSKQPSPAAAAVGLRRLESLAIPVKIKTLTLIETLLAHGNGQFKCARYPTSSLSSCSD